MNRIYRICSIRRFAGALAGLAAALVALGAAAPAALAVNVPPPAMSGGAPVPPAPVSVVATGMPGWQITLIAIGAALLAATLAVLLDRTRAKRHTTTAPAS
jgi:hypothetical protein